ncbi:hypothetical protein FRC16_002152 [Serendipita sp. 398]|nr:hypothetical protein FRC16_002152 [Serendipita sp. 398]
MLQTTIEQFLELQRKAGKPFQITRPIGEAGRKIRKRHGVDTGKVFNLRQASRLSKVHYAALQHIVKIYTYKYADPTKTWKKNEAHLGEVIAAVRKRITNIDTYSEPVCWIVKDMMKIFLRSSSTTLRKAPNYLQFLAPDVDGGYDESSDDDADAESEEESDREARKAARKRKDRPDDNEKKQEPVKRAKITDGTSKARSEPGATPVNIEADSFGVTDWNDVKQIDPVYHRLLKEAGYNELAPMEEQNRIINSVRTIMKDARDAWKERRGLAQTSHLLHSPPGLSTLPIEVSVSAWWSLLPCVTLTFVSRSRAPPKSPAYQPVLRPAIFSQSSDNLGPMEIAHTTKPLQSNMLLLLDISPERLRQTNWDDEASVSAMENEIFTGDAYANADNQTRDRIEAWWAGYTANKSHSTPARNSQLPSWQTIRSDAPPVAPFLFSMKPASSQAKQDSCRGVDGARNGQVSSGAAIAAETLASILPPPSLKWKRNMIPESGDDGEDEVDVVLKQKMKVAAPHPKPKVK